MPNYPLSKKWIRSVFAGTLIVFFTTMANGLSIRDPAYDMVWQDYGGGWSYMYNAPVDYAYWKNGSSVRFAYGYNSGQWCDTGLGGGWQTLGTGLTSTFLGDGGYHDLKNGWSYMYNASIDYAYWRDGSDVRFAYGYTGGQWNDTGLGGGWQTLASGLTPTFLGNGGYYDLKNGWSYMYNASIDYAYWKDGSDVRFAYGYTGGQWNDTGLGGTWQTLASGLTPTFLGNGGYYDLKNGWSYMYNASIDYAYWKDGSYVRLAYGYTGGQWNDTGLGGTWQTLASGLTSTFIGDGVYHDMQNGWSYMYLASVDYAYWKDGSAVRFAYGYNGGQWCNTGIGGGWQTVGTGVSPTFIGDGQSHHVFNNEQGSWNYTYVGLYGEWTGASIDYRYYYDTGQWKVRDITGTVWGNLGLAGQPASCTYADLGRQVSGVVNPYWFTWYNSALYFSAYDDLHGQELWKWDGIQTTLVSDINKGLDGSHPEYSSNPAYLNVYNGKLYFGAADGLGLNLSNLYVYDGSTVTELHNTAFLNVDHGGPVPNAEHVNNLVVYNSVLYFSETNGVYGWGLYSYDGSTFGRRGGDYNLPGVVVSQNPYFTLFNGALYFGGDWNYAGTSPYSEPHSLWKFDGSNITPVGNFGPPENNNPNNPIYLSHLLVHNGALYFAATDRAGAHGLELWKCTTSDVVSRVIDLNTGNPPGSNPSYGSEPGMLTTFNGLLNFTANDGINGFKLYSYNDTSNAFTRIDQPAVGMYSANEPFTVYNGTMVCETGGDDLYMNDGTNWFLIGKSGSRAGWYDKPRHYGVFEGHYFYQGKDGKLWQWQ